MNTTAAHNNRIQWIDAMRGVTMILVVFSHVQVSSLGMTQSIVNNFFSMFRMPLFFFVSGFIAFRPKLWNWGEYGRQIGHKIRVQLLPMMFFGLLYAAVVFTHKYHCSIPIAFKCFLMDRTHLGYWFTEALLLMFAIYYTIELMFRNRPNSVPWIMAGVAGVCYLLSLPGVHFYSQWVLTRALSLQQMLLYFQFFVIGNIFARHQAELLPKLQIKAVCWGIVCVFALLFLAYRGMAEMNLHSAVYKVVNKVLLECVRLFGMASMVALFCKYKTAFASNRGFGRSIQFVGRRTLDIYLMHFFLLPLVKVAGNWLDFNVNVVVLTLFCFVVAIAISSICLGVGQLVRCWPMLAHIILGAKLPEKS